MPVLMNFLQRAWRRSSPWLYLLWPLSLAFQALAAMRRRRQQAGARRRGRAPVIVVGNITLGGTGKTSLLIALAEALGERGYSPGVISRGYGARAGGFPRVAGPASDPVDCGDEPVLIAQHTRCPVVVDPDRCRALGHLLENFEVDVVLSDDGLQHYRLHRDIEIAVVDGNAMFGNGLCLPAGPLREPRRRLGEVDFVVVNGEPGAALDLPVPVFRVDMEAKGLVNLHSGEERPFGGAPFHVGNVLQLVCGIGNPERFFRLMQTLPYPVARVAFPDHHRFRPEDFDDERIDQRQPIVMTGKDAVKCRSFALPNCWELRAGMTLPPEFVAELLQRLAGISSAREATPEPESEPGSEPETET